MDVLACASVGHFIPHQINEICNVNVKGSFESDVKNLENLRIEGICGLIQWVIVFVLMIQKQA